MTAEQILESLKVPSDFKDKSVCEFAFLYASDGKEGVNSGFLYIDPESIQTQQEMFDKVTAIIGMFITAHARFRENLLRLLPLVLFVLTYYKSEAVERFGKQPEEVLAALAVSYLLTNEDLEKGRDELIRLRQMAEALGSKIPSA